MGLDAANPWGQPLRLLVVRDATDDDGDIWLRIQLPIRPNGQAGWVAASDVRLTEADERVVIDLSERRLVGSAKANPSPGSTSRSGPPRRPLLRAATSCGRRSGPDRPSGPYGNFILGLSGFSDGSSHGRSGRASLGSPSMGPTTRPIRITP